ncbi:MAG: 50S ribosomal protein L4 [Chloroflexi bacterium]|nr:50S ribosomal protein L4 [Chloroflexota bacterium]
MVEVPVYNQAGEVVEQATLDEAVFGVRPRIPLMHQAMVMYQANLRQGTASTKTRAEVRGGGRKPWRQKGTGRARAGSRRSPLWRGGGVAFGPKPREYRQRMPRKMRQLALCCALSEKVREQQLLLFDELTLEQPRTKEMVELLRRFSVLSAVIAFPGKNEAVIQAVRNVPRVTAVPADSLNLLTVMRHRYLMMTLDAARQVEAWLGGNRA